MNDDNIKRYCPHCGKAASAERRTFESPIKCPNCGKTGDFVDPLASTEIRLNALDTLLNQNMKIFNVAAAAVLLIVLICLLFSGGSTKFIISLICLLVAVIAGLLYFNQRAAVASLKERAVKFDEVSGKHATLKSNFDAIISGEKIQLQEKMQEKMLKLAHMEMEAREKSVAAVVIAERFLEDTVKWTGKRLTSNNYAASKKRLLKVVEFCRKAGYPISQNDEDRLIDDLKEEYEKVLRIAFDREEQARIKAHIREEEKAKREFDRELARIEAEKKAVEAALAVALKKVEGEHSEEVESLRAKLKEAEERLQRTKSMAELTKAGHVYIISNIGSFGENVYKIGLSRRLEPRDRVKELGDASVPFAFDIHMMIHSEDAPALEKALHKEFHRMRLNKVNMRKEFFSVGLEDIRRIVERSEGEVKYMVAEPEALEYRQSLEMDDEDFDFITDKFREIGGEEAFTNE
jgi:hypothetical protein